MPGQLFAPGHINISVTNWAPTGILLFGDERVEPFFTSTLTETFAVLARRCSIGSPKYFTA